MRGTGKQVEDKGLGLCGYERMPGKQRCVWHWLMAQPADVQTRHAANRREDRLGHDFAEFVARVAKEKCPAGERWCAGCQSFVPLFYVTGSRCKACASAASHGLRVHREYGLEPGEYDRLLRFQGGVCYICRRKPRTKRLAVDHDHQTGQVRGLLCANNENGCNRAVIANLEAAVDGGLAAAERVVAYLSHPPYARMTGQEPQKPAQERRNPVRATPEPLPPPF